MLNETDLIENVLLKRDSDSYLILKSKYENCFYDIYHKYRGRLYESGVSPEDSLTDVDFILIKSINDFDPSLNVKFSTFFTGRSIFHFKTLTSGKRSVQYKKTSNLETEIYENFEDESIYSPVDHARFSDCLELVSEIIDRDIFSEKKKSILRLKFLSEEGIVPTKDVARRLGLKYGSVSLVIKESMKKIKKILLSEKKLSTFF